MINRPFRIKAVLFDFDGTLTKPGALDFPLLTGSRQAVYELENRDVRGAADGIF